MQAGKAGGLCEGVLRGRDHQKEQLARAHALKAPTDGDLPCDPRMYGASGHGASPSTSPQIGVEAMTLRGRGRGVQPSVHRMSSVVLWSEPPCEPQTVGDG